MRIVSRTGIGKNPGTVYHLDVSGSSNFDGQVFFQNNVFLNANVDLGNANTDLVSFNGRCTTSIVPNTTTISDLGSNTLYWNNTYSKNLMIQNSGSIESNGNILNLGTNSASTINIGKSGTTVNIYGSVNKIQSTDTEVFDKLITLNKNGLASSATEAGFEIEENSLITGYIKTSSDRNQWVFKSPNKSGFISLEAGSSAFTHKIVSQASADRVWTLPDNTDTFVGTTNSQTINNKTLNNTTVTGDITITGRAIGVGFIPIGGVIAIMPHLSGTYNCTATTSADSYGFVRCGFTGQVGSQVISDPTSPMNGQIVPKINDDVFLMGNVTSGLNGGANSKIIEVTNLPAHSHSMTHNHAMTHSHPIPHTHTINHGHTGYTESVPDHTHGIRLEFGTTSVNNAPPGQYNQVTNNAAYVHQNGGQIQGNGGHWHTIVVNNHNGSSGSVSTANSSNFTGNTADYSGNTGNSGGGTAFNVQPKYISATYIMRIK